MITAVYHRARRIRPVGYRSGSRAGGRAEGEGESNERSERQSFLRGELSEGPAWVGQAPQPGSNGVRLEGPGRARERDGAA